jgi:hypothetical protein
VRRFVLTCTASSLLLTSATTAQQPVPPLPVVYGLEPQPRTTAELAKRFTPAQRSGEDDCQSRHQISGIPADTTDRPARPR